MSTRLIVHDLPDGLAEQLDLPDCTLFPAVPTVHYCVGCFGCWMKTPGTCVLKDRGREFAQLVPRHDELVIVTRLVFGAVSPDVKAVMDRSIGVLLPFFRVIGGEMHHSLRYAIRPNLRYVFYGDHITDAEKATARRLVEANAVNLEPKQHSVEFYESAAQAAQAVARAFVSTPRDVATQSPSSGAGEATVPSASEQVPA